MAAEKFLAFCYWPSKRGCTHVTMCYWNLITVRGYILCTDSGGWTVGST